MMMLHWAAAAALLLLSAPSRGAEEVPAAESWEEVPAWEASRLAARSRFLDARRSEALATIDLRPRRHHHSSRHRRHRSPHRRHRQHGHRRLHLLAHQHRRSRLPSEGTDQNYIYDGNTDAAALPATVSAGGTGVSSESFGEQNRMISDDNFLVDSPAGMVSAVADGPAAPVSAASLSGSEVPAPKISSYSGWLSTDDDYMVDGPDPAPAEPASAEKAKAAAEPATAQKVAQDPDSRGGKGPESADGLDPDADFVVDGPAPAVPPGAGQTEWLSADDLAKRRFAVSQGDGSGTPGEQLLPSEDSARQPLEHSLENPARVHPLVDRQMDKRDKEFKDLQATRTQTEEDRQEMSAQTANAIAHMNDAVGMQREQARAQDIEQAQEKAIAKLQSEGSKLEGSHDDLVEKLNMIMTPKIEHANKTLQHEEERLTQARAEAESREQKVEEAKEAAVLAVKERRDMLKKLRASEAELAKATKQHEQDEKLYRAYKAKSTGKVEALNWAETELRASLDTAAESETAEKEASASLAKLQGVRDMEVKRVDQALLFGKQRLGRKKHRLQKIRAEAERAAKLLNERYLEWQERQRQRAADIAEKKAAYQASLNSYTDERKKLYGSAQTEAGERAEAHSDWAWDDWAWTGHGDSTGGAAVSLDKPLEGGAPAPAPVSA